jgi:hypothetical protein
MTRTDSNQGWQSIRQQFPNKWVLLEARSAHSKENKRVIDDIGVLDAFGDGEEAMRRYLLLHKQDHNRELYVVHTDKESLDITEKRWVGIRRM